MDCLRFAIEYSRNRLNMRELRHHIRVANLWHPTFNDQCEVGAGPAGLAAATAAARALSPRGKSVLLVEAAGQAGGSYWSDPRFGHSAVDQTLREATTAGVEVLTDAAAIGYYPEDEVPEAPERRGLIAVLTPQGLLKLTADRVIYATGGHEQNLLFADNDRPGVLSARAVGRLHTQYGLSLGTRPLLVGDGEYSDALAAALGATGAAVQRVDGRSETVARALGRSWVTGAVLTTAEGFERQIECDLIAVVQPPAPAFELARMHGAELRFDATRGFVVMSDEAGRIGAGSALACGEVIGSDGVVAARLSGQRAGSAVAAELA